MLFLVALAASVPMLAATATDFYVELLRRGVSEVEAGRNESAVTPLRLAAFGLIDSIEHYQTAQAYLVVAFERLNQPDAARQAALRIVAAEKVERKFASLHLPDSIRSSFTTSTRKLLAPSDAALLSAPASPAKTTTQPPQTSAKLTQTDAPKVAGPPSRPADVKPIVDPPVVETIVEKPAPDKASDKASDKPVQKPVQKPAQMPAATTPAPKPIVPAPKAAPVQTQPAKPALDVPARLSAGERALVAANLAEARRIYRELLDAGGHDHTTWLRVAEGLYRSRDFAGALAAFQHVGAFRPGEEAYRYYVAVALYENRQYDRAKRELAAALPFIEITPDVDRYRAKIESAQ